MLLTTLMTCCTYSCTKKDLNFFRRSTIYVCPTVVYSDDTSCALPIRDWSKFNQNTFRNSGGALDGQWYVKLVVLGGLPNKSVQGTRYATGIVRIQIASLALNWHWRNIILRSVWFVIEQCSETVTSSYATRPWRTGYVMATGVYRL
jgi:hypothetical protein